MFESAVISKCKNDNENIGLKNVINVISNFPKLKLEEDKSNDCKLQVFDLKNHLCTYRGQNIFCVF